MYVGYCLFGVHSMSFYWPCNFFFVFFFFVSLLFFLFFLFLLVVLLQSAVAFYCQLLY